MSPFDKAHKTHAKLRYLYAVPLITCIASEFAPEEIGTEITLYAMLIALIIHHFQTKYSNIMHYENGKLEGEIRPSKYSIRGLI